MALQEVTSYCGACGKPVSGAAFCSSCGSPVGFAASAPPEHNVGPATARSGSGGQENKKSRKTKRKLVAAGVGLLILGSAVSDSSETTSGDSGSSGEKSAVVENSAAGQDAAGNSEPDDANEAKAVKVNEPLSLTGTTYTVTGVRTAQSLGESFARVDANGTFVIVDVTLVNEKDEPATIMSDALRLIGSNGASYSTSDDALLAVDDQFLLEEIQPGLTERGTLVYDLPPSALNGAHLEMSDLFSDAKGRVKLGL